MELQSFVLLQLDHGAAAVSCRCSPTFTPIVDVVSAIVIGPGTSPPLRAMGATTWRGHKPQPMPAAARRCNVELQSGMGNGAY